MDGRMTSIRRSKGAGRIAVVAAIAFSLSCPLVAVGQVDSDSAPTPPKKKQESDTKQDKKGGVQTRNPKKGKGPIRQPVRKTGTPAAKNGKRDDPRPATPQQKSPGGRARTQPAGQKKGPSPTPLKEQVTPTGQPSVEHSSMDPDLKKRIDELLEGQLRQRSEQRRQGATPARPASRKTEPTKTPADRGKPAVRPGTRPVKPAQKSAGPSSKPATTGSRASEAPGGPTAKLNIPPVVSNIAPEERTYRFSIKGGSYEQLVEGFARQTGLGVLGNAPKDGKVTFVTTEELDFENSLSRVRNLLFNYKPHDPYWIVFEGSYLRVVRVVDYYRILPRERMFDSVEELWAADLPGDELVLVIYTPKTGSLAGLKEVRDHMPDYLRVDPLEDKNRVTIYALVSDIEKYINLITFFGGTFTDPRTTELIEIEHILPSEALNKLRLLMDLDGGGSGAVRPRTQSRRGSRESSTIDVMPEPEVTVIPEDAHGYILVRAMQGKIDEIKKMLPFVDVAAPELTGTPVIIPLMHAVPEQLINTLNQILNASTPGGATSTKSTRARRASKPGATTVIAGSLTLFAHPGQQAIIVIGDEEQVAKVRKLVTLFDVEDQLDPVRIPVEHVEAADISQTVLIILQGSEKGKVPSQQFHLMPDPSSNALWFNGSARDLKRVRDIMRQLDSPVEVATLHILQLQNQTPSFVADMLKQYEGERASKSGSRKTKSGARATARKIAVAGKFTPDDLNRRLFILCTNEEWEDYQPLIKQLDGLSSVGDPFVRVELKNVDAGTAVDRLRTMVGDLEGRGGPVRYLPSEGGMLIVGATDEQLIWIRRFLPEVDWAPDVEQRTFDIRHADPEGIKTLIETLMGSRGATAGTNPRRKGGDKKGLAVTFSGGGLSITRYGRRLIVDATPADMARIEELITEYDVEMAETELRIYDDFPPGTDIAGLSDTLKAVITGQGVRSLRGAKPKAGDTSAPVPTFIPQPASSRLVVIAQPADFAEIERLLDVLKTDIEFDPIEVVSIAVQHVQADTLIETIEPLIDMQIRDLVASGQLDEPVDGVSKPKLPRRPGKARTSGSSRYHLGPAAANTQIVIAAPKKIIDVATNLIRQFDVPGAAESEVIVRTVLLRNTDAESMVKAVKEMKGAPTGRVRAPAGKSSAQSAGGPPPLSVVEAPSGGAVVLRGAAEEVEEAAGWIEYLDSITTGGRAIKVYDIQNADITRLVDLIMNVVDEPQRTDARRPKPRRRSGSNKDSADDDLFATTKTWKGDQVYIQADFVSRTMLVATSDARMSQVDDIVRKYDDPEEAITETPMPSKIFKLEFAEASSASWDLDALLSQMWQPADNLPRVETSLFGNALIVRYHDATRFEEIADLVNMIDRPSEEDLRVERKGFTPPEGLSAHEVALWLKMKHPEYEIVLQDISEPQVDYGVEEVRPLSRGGISKKRRSNPCVMPVAFVGLASQLVTGSLGQTEPSSDEPEAPAETPADAQPAPDPVEPADNSEPGPDEVDDDLLGADDALEVVGGIDDVIAEPRPKRRTEPQASETEDLPTSKRKKLPSGQQLKVFYSNDKGVFVVEGPAGVIEEIAESLKELEEELDKFPKPPDIRIYRVRYIDVFSAKDILDEMFNATKQQRAAVQAAQRRVQQQQRQQSAQQRRQAQQKQAKGDQAGQDAKRPSRQQQQQANVLQLPPTTVRVLANPRDRTLILRADTNQYPAILELLATIDQPKPFDSELRLYPLRKLNAVEVEQTLGDLLGIGQRRKAQPKKAAKGRAAAASSPSLAGAQLPQTIMQEMVTGTGALGVDPADIKLSSNEAANTIIAMAPPAALDFIGSIIDRLESADIPERFPKHYELEHADAAELAEYLQTQFAGLEGVQTKRKGVRVSKGAATSSAALDAPSFIAYPPLNLLTVHATEEDIAQIDELVARIDVPGAGDRWEDVALKQADAGVVADTLAKMFGGGAKAPKGRGKGAVASSATGPKFIGDEGGRILFFSASEGLRDQILTTVAKLEAEAADQTMLRVVELEFAIPSKVAEAINEAMGGVSRGRGGKGAKAKTDARFTITAADSLKRLFVRADEDMFAEIASLANKLDAPHNIGFEFRIYKLQYADAKKVHEQMSKLMTDFFRLAGRDTEIPPFSVEADASANALVVLGSPMVFGFLDEIIAKIDIPSNATSPTSVMMVPLKFAIASEVAQNISNLWGDRNLSAGETPPQVEANQTMNMLIVRGSQTQLDEIKTTFLDPLGDDELMGAIERKQHVFRLTHADATAVAAELAQLFRPSGGSRRGDLGPVFVGDAAANALVAHVNEDELEDVRRLVLELDEASEKGSVPQIITLTHAKVGQVLPTLQELFAEPRGGPRGQEAPVFGADEATNRLIVRASPTEFNAIEAIVKELDTPEAADKPGFRIIKVPQGINISDLAQKVQQSVNDGAVAVTGRGQKTPSITVTPDKRAHLLIVSGTPTLFDQAEALADTISKMGPSGGRVTKVIRLTELDVRDALRVIDQLTGRGSSDGSRQRRATPRRSGASRPRSTGSRPRSTGSNRGSQSRRRGR